MKGHLEKTRVSIDSFLEATKFYRNKLTLSGSKTPLSMEEVNKDKTITNSLYFCKVFSESQKVTPT